MLEYYSNRGGFQKWPRSGSLLKNFWTPQLGTKQTVTNYIFNSSCCKSSGMCIYSQANITLILTPL